ncbi:MAG TPA: chemotaxis protein CheB [Candidatus Thermoplasmatota archaeon]|nr:chemotaxis protein CheB [Candidatus Thermoplasmatota archaeon]
MVRPRIVVVGASAGGMDALTRLVAQLPADFPAAVFIVQHMSADTSGEPLLRALSRAGKLPCTRAKNLGRFKAGHIYIATPDHHLLVGKQETLMVTKGARENRSRPGIDPLFRSAAVAYGKAVVGVLLTGYLDDGTSGLVAIKRCGGTSVVQDPEDAAYPDMPSNAIENADVDHVVPVAEMGALLVQLVARPLGKRVAPPPDIVTEARIAERVLSDLQAVEALGTQVPFNCPGCGGVLWQMAKGDTRYRCHTGHSFTAPVLLAEQTAKIEETLWVSLRMLEERRNLLMTMARSKSRVGTGSSALERAQESMVHIKRIRAMLTSGDRKAEAARGHARPKRPRATPRPDALARPYK